MALTAGSRLSHARVIALTVVAALVHGALLHAQQDLSELPLDELRVLAEQGDAEAQNSLGDRIFGDRAQQARWYRLAAEQGHAEAQMNLGGMFWLGLGVPQSDDEASPTGETT
jgi:TPR repeat protein